MELHHPRQGGVLANSGQNPAELSGIRASRACLKVFLRALGGHLFRQCKGDQLVSATPSDSAAFRASANRVGGMSKAKLLRLGEFASSLPKGSISRDPKGLSRGSLVLRRPQAYSPKGTSSYLEDVFLSIWPELL